MRAAAPVALAVLVLGCDAGDAGPPPAEPLIDGLSAAAQDETFCGSVIASDPDVLRVGDGYEMFYTELDTETTRTVIARASSTDSARWTPGPARGGVAGLVLGGRDGAWDENLESAAVIETEKGRLLLYSGYRDEGDPFKGFPADLGAAIERDGRFERVSDAPILRRTKGWYDNDAIYSATVIRDGDGFVMFYVGHAYTDLSGTGGAGGVFLLRADSRDGLDWRKAPKPVFAPGDLPDWMREGVAEPWLTRGPEGEYLLFFTGLEGEEREIGVASAQRLEGPWRFRATPIVNNATPTEGDVKQTLAPAVLIEDGGVRMWYLAARRDDKLCIARAEGALAPMLLDAVADGVTK